jgi:hypothetical protein
MSLDLTRWMLLWLTPLLALSSAGRPVVDAHLVANALIEAAARASSGEPTDGDSDERGTPVIIGVDDPWDRVVRAGGVSVGVEPISLATPRGERTELIAHDVARLFADDTDYMPARLMHLARLWSCGPPAV